MGQTYHADNSPHHAFLYSSGVMTDLNTLLDSSGTGWTLTDAQGINDSGWIAASGFFGGQQRAVLLVPLPEPSSALLAVSIVALLAGRRSRR